MPLNFLAVNLLYWLTTHSFVTTTSSSLKGEMKPHAAYPSQKLLILPIYSKHSPTNEWLSSTKNRQGIMLFRQKYSEKMTTQHHIRTEWSLSNYFSEKIKTQLNRIHLNNKRRLLNQVLLLNLTALLYLTPFTIQCFFARFLITAHPHIIFLACFQLCESIRSP